MKKFLVFSSLMMASALLLAQGTSSVYMNSAAPIGPGDPGWTGQTIQMSAPNPTPDVGGLNPTDIMKPLSDEWRTYSGDLTGKRYSLLKQVNTTTVKNVGLQWVAHLTTACGPNGTGQTGAAPAAAGGFGGGGAAAAAPEKLVIGGLGAGDANSCGPRALGGGILMVDGILYGGTPDNVYAIDAHDGTVLWHYYWKTRGGESLQSRGVGMWHNYVYFELHDDWVVCLDSKTGREIWRHEIAPYDQQYFSSNAPMVIGDHLLVGTGDDLDNPAFLKSLNPRTGAVEWILYSTPMKEGDPGLDTWPSLDAARHGNGATWIPGSYDPDTHLYMYGTGNPTPAYTAGRGNGDNLFTSALLAVNVDTGKIVWYYQPSPHDTHDWDSTQTPVLFDGMFGGRLRKLLMMATRNGYFFVLDRTTGEHLVTGKLGLVNNFAMGLDEKGQPKRNPNKDATVAGSLVNSDVLNYPPPTFSPDTGLFYVHEQNGLRISYLMMPDDRGSAGLGGASGGANVGYGTNIDAIDYKTGKVVWRHPINGGSSGLLSTAGGLIFAADGQNVEAWDALTGKALWYSQIGGLNSPPETFMLDGKQHLLFNNASGLYMFVLN